MSPVGSMTTPLVSASCTSTCTPSTVNPGMPVTSSWVPTVIAPVPHASTTVIVVAVFEAMTR